MTRTLANLGIGFSRGSLMGWHSRLSVAFHRVLKNSVLRTGILVILFTSLLLGWGAVWSRAAIALPPGNAITDGKALLRYALPIDNKPIRELQATLEGMSGALRTRRVGNLNRNLDIADRVLNQKQAELLASVPDDRKPQAEAIMAQLKTGVAELRAEVQAKDRKAIWTERAQLLDLVGQLEELMVSKFPFEVPVEYSTLPQLKGRATIEMETSKGTVTLVVDGYNAPVTAGNFVDLVQRGFYDGLEFTRTEDNYVAQVGDPPGKEIGFVDPDTGKYRAVPLEIMVQGDKKPTYGITLEDAGRYLDQPVLPFSAFGALGMAHSSNDPNDGSSQFFFFLFEPELTPAGLNLLDGRYSIFGYVIENKQVLDELKAGDKVISTRVIQGLENLVEPQQAA